MGDSSESLEHAVISTGGEQGIGWMHARIILVFSVIFSQEKGRQTKKVL